MNRVRHHIPWSSVLALALGCGEEPSAPLPQSPPPEPTPEVQTEVTPELARENCDVEVLGDREVVRAALDTKNGRLTQIEVIDGRTLRIDCPAGEERMGALIIAELKAKDGVHSIDNIVSWTVDLNPDPKTTKLRLVEATPGVPPLNEEDLALLKQEVMPDMVEWQGEAAGETETGEDPPVAEPVAEPGNPVATPTPAKKIVAKVEVEFNAGRLKWAELMYEHQATKRSKKVVLGNKATKSLEPGTYKLSVRYPENSQEWRDAGTLEIAEGLRVVQVTMKESPSLHGDIVSSQ